MPWLQARSLLLREYCVRKYTLGTSGKRDRAERGRRGVGTWLSKEMALSGSRIWAWKLPTVISRHNERKLRGTSFAPSEVDRDNLSEFLRQKYGVEDWDALSATHRIDAESMARPDLVFNFDDDQLVAAERKLVGEVSESRFDKKTARGYFSEKLFRIHQRVLGTTRKLRGVQSKRGGSMADKQGFILFFLPVYRLRPHAGGAPLAGWFYHFELLAVAEEGEEV